MRTQAIKRGRIAALVIVATGVLLAVLLVRQTPPAAPLTDRPSQVASASQPAVAVPSVEALSSDSIGTGNKAPDSAWKSELSQTSLRDADIDGALHFGPDGRLRPDADLLRRFDFFLALSGERSDADIRRLLLASIADQYGPVAAAEAAAWFDRYLGLRAELAAQLGEADLTRDLAAIERAQRRWFGDHAEAMFAAENDYRAIAAERMRLQRDTQLSEADRAALEAELDARLPEAVRDDLQQSANVELAHGQTRQFEQQGLSEAQRRSEREALFGADAAQRLAELDRQRATWDQRVADYVRQRDQLQTRAWRDASQQQAALANLRNSLFSGPDLRRVESLEAVGQLPPGG